MGGLGEDALNNYIAKVEEKKETENGENLLKEVKELCDWEENNDMINHEMNEATERFLLIHEKELDDIITTIDNYLTNWDFSSESAKSAEAQARYILAYCCNLKLRTNNWNKYIEHWLSAGAEDYLKTHEQTVDLIIRKIEYSLKNWEFSWDEEKLNLENKLAYFREFKKNNFSSN